VLGAAHQGPGPAVLKLQRRRGRGLGGSVSFPDFRQLRLFSERVRIVRTVFDGVGLVPGVVADGADVDVEGGADHLAIRVLQHMRGVHGLRLIVVLAKHTIGWKFFGLLCLFLVGE